MGNIMKKLPSQQLKINSPGSTANKLSVGNRVYNGFSNSPHSGGGLEKGGYANRDAQAKVKRQALMNQLKRFGR